MSRQNARAEFVKNSRSDTPFQDVWQLRPNDWNGAILTKEEVAQKNRPTKI